MFNRGWIHEIRGAAGFWIAGLVFLLVGTAFTAVGALVLEPLVFIGIPFLVLGGLILILLIYSLYLKLRHPENYEAWLWWINFIGGLLGALTFALPSTFALPILLILEVDEAPLWIGALFSAVGLGVLVATWLIARRQLQDRPRWVTGNHDEREMEDPWNPSN